jgi:hypothetical protein
VALPTAIVNQRHGRIAAKRKSGKFAWGRFKTTPTRKK